MQFNSLKTRLLALERKSSAQDIVLIFGDGSTRGVRVRDPLGLVVASFSRIHARATGEPWPTSANDAVLDLMAAAIDVADGSDPFLSLGQECARKAAEMNPKNEVTQ